MSEESGATYRVVASGAILQQLRRWADLARNRGVLEPYVQILKTIETNLRTRPLDWGDPLYRYQHLELSVCRGLHGYFLVEYGVHERERLVFVRQYRLVPGNPLESSP